ncbi:MAG: NUDIX domain-containing protein [Candidatus Aenigmatarchaeota archaeon]
MPEEVLVVPRKVLFGEKNERYFQGFIPRKNLEFENIIRKKSLFILRKVTSPKQKKPAEEDPEMKQVIPYIIFKYKDEFFVYKRLEKSDEKRLVEKYSMGIGGHINPIDKGDLLSEAMKREFFEEVDYPYRYKSKIIGFINDDSDDVGKVHFGVVFLVEGSNKRIEVKEKDKIVGRMMTLAEARKLRDRMESWSRFVLDWLKVNKM